MTTLLDAAFGQCRTPLWGDDCPRPEAMLVCGRPALPGQSYCKDCRSKLIAGRSRPDGSAVWFRSVDEKKAGAALRKETAAV